MRYCLSKRPAASLPSPLTATPFICCPEVAKDRDVIMCIHQDTVTDLELSFFFRFVPQNYVPVIQKVLEEGASPAQEEQEQARIHNMTVFGKHPIPYRT